MINNSNNINNYYIKINNNNLFINKLKKNIIDSNNIKNIIYIKKTPKYIDTYIKKNYKKIIKINKNINKNIIKKINRDDFDLLFDFSKEQIKITKNPIYGLIIKNKSKNINKILYYNNKIIKSIIINNYTLKTINKLYVYINEKNIFEFTNKFYNILNQKKKNNYISSKYILLIIYNSIIFSSIYIHNSNYLISNILIIAKKISNFVQIIKNNDKIINKKNIISLYNINIINNSLLKCNLKEYNYIPIPINISSYIKKKENSNILLFNNTINNTIKFINKIFIKEKINWSIDSKINIIFSKLLPIGSGWYRLFYNKN
uniref:RNA polymerase C2b n=1 Tax=Babesia rodhaini TaxID=5870 RepID=A0A455QY64_BABRO|nr:RNA polymerase C2b [Babesia rodhaini]